MTDKVLVTGGAGFVGSHVADAYLEAGWEVTVLDDLSTGRREMVPTAARFVQADVRSPEARQLLVTGGVTPLNHHPAPKGRAEEGRVGEEGRIRGGAGHLKKKKQLPDVVVGGNEKAVIGVDGNCGAAHI